MKRMLLALIAVVLAACDVAVAPGSLTVIVGTPRTIQPELDLVVTSFSVVATADDGGTLSADSDGPVVSFESVTPGSWDLAATAFNAAGVPILGAAKSVYVSPRLETSVAMVLEPLLGSGRVELSVLWPETGVVEPLVTAILSRGDEERLLNLECAGSACTGVVSDIPSGYHVLTVALSDGEERVTGMADSVRVLAGELTSVTVDFSNGQRMFRGDIAVSLVLDDDPPIDVVIGGVPPTVYEGEYILPTVEDPIAPISWFVNGRPVASSGFLVPSTGESVRVTAIAQLDDRAGSMSLVVPLGAGKPIGGIVHNDTADSDELTLSSPQSIALAHGSVYFSDYEREQTWRASVDPSSGTVDRTPELLAEEFCLLRSVPVNAGMGDDHRVAWLVSSSLVRRYSADATLTSPTLDEGLAIAESVLAADDATAVVLSGAAMHRVDLVDGDLQVEELDLPPELAGADVRDADLGNSGDIWVADFAGDRVVRLRDTADGPIVVQELIDGIAGVDELNGASGVLLLDRDLYACSYYDGALVWFRRNADSGMFELQATVPDVAPGATGLATAPEGDRVYVIAGTGDSLAVFRRDVGTGAIALEGVFEQPGGMDSPRAVSSSGDLVVIAAANSRSVEVFREYRTPTVE